MNYIMRGFVSTTLNPTDQVLYISYFLLLVSYEPQVDHKA